MMNDKMNKTSICSILVLDIIDYAKKTVAEQTEIKSLFNSFINQAIIDIPQEDRLLVDTINGAAIACTGPLEDALEDALFISITIRDEILKNNAQGLNPLYVQFGINLGAARAVSNANTQPSLVGDGVDEAKRIMSFANSNQILVSQVYFEMASKLTQEIAQMFEKYDMHAHEHDVYAVRLLKDKVANDDATSAVAEPVISQVIASKTNWVLISTGLLVLAAFYTLVKMVSTPIEPTITLVQPELIKPAPISTSAQATVEKQAEVVETTVNTENSKLEEEPIVAAKPVPPTPAQSEQNKVKVVQKKPQQKAVAEAKVSTNKTENSSANKPDDKAPTAKPAEAKVATKGDKNSSNDKSGWQTFKDSIKSGADRKCTQAEIALNQCN